LYIRSIAKENIIDKTILFVTMLIYKFILEFGFWYLLQIPYGGLNVYKFDFNIEKYVFGVIVCVCLFLLIDHNKRYPSTFFLQMHYFIAIIPITVIYAFSDANTLYYTTVCIAFAIAEICVMLFRDMELPQINITTKVLVVGFYIITIIVYLDIIRENGLFDFRAINIYRVYEVRKGFILNKYIGYLFKWQNTIITPFFIIRAYKRKKFCTMLFFCTLQFITYLYCGEKSVLFIIPVVIFISIISNWKRFGLITYVTLTAGTVFATIGGFFSRIINNIYDLFVRRVLLLPANLKFIYYDFFSKNDKIGLAGTLWGKFLEVSRPYKERIGVIISAKYFNNPETNSNTGFLAEGYYRFGLFGIFLVLLLFVFILMVLDIFAKQNGYSFAVGMGFYSIFLLNDGELIDPLIFGQLTVLICVCIFYKFEDDFKGTGEKRTLNLENKLENKGDVIL